MYNFSFHRSFLHILLACALLIFSWGPAFPPAHTLKAPSVLYNASSESIIVLPSGTKTNIKNIDNKSILSVELPSGFMWAVHQQDASAPYTLVKRSKGPEYVCSGCKRGCEAFHHNNVFACTACEEDETYKSCAGQLMGFPTIKSPILGYGPLNTKVGIGLIESTAALSKLIPGPDFLLQIPEVREKLKAFNKRIHGAEEHIVTDINRDRHVGVMINVFGALGIYFLPRNDVYQDPKTSDYQYRPDKGKPIRVVPLDTKRDTYSCSCNDKDAETRDYCLKEEDLSILRCIPAHGCQRCKISFQ